MLPAPKTRSEKLFFKKSYETAERFGLHGCIIHQAVKIVTHSVIIRHLTPGRGGHKLRGVILNGQWFGSEFADWYYFTSAAGWRFRLA